MIREQRKHNNKRKLSKTPCPIRAISMAVSFQISSGRHKGAEEAKKACLAAGRVACLDLVSPQEVAGRTHVLNRLSSPGG